MAFKAAARPFRKNCTSCAHATHEGSTHHGGAMKSELESTRTNPLLKPSQVAADGVVVEKMFGDDVLPRLVPVRHSSCPEQVQERRSMMRGWRETEGTETCREGQARNIQRRRAVKPTLNRSFQPTLPGAVALSTKESSWSLEKQLKVSEAGFSEEKRSHWGASSMADLGLCGLKKRRAKDAFVCAHVHPSVCACT